MVYISLVFTILIMGLFSYNQSTFPKNRTFLLLSSTILIVMAGLRNFTVGVDTFSYVQIFESVKGVPIIDFFNGNYYEYRSIETGYLIWNKVISIFSNNAQMMIFFNSFLYICLMFNFIKKNSVNVFLTVFIFFAGGMYILFFNLMRQMIAIAFISNSFIYYKDRKYWLSILLFLLAFSFHVISIVGIVMFVVSKIKYTKFKITISFFIITFVGLNYIFFVNLITQVLPRFAKYLNNQGIVNPIGGIFIFFVIDIILILYAVYIAKWDEKWHEITFLSIMTSLYILFVLLGSQFNFLDRVGLVFKPFEVLFVSIVLEKISGRYKYIVLIGYCMLLIMYFILSTVYSDQYQYVFFWKG